MATTTPTLETYQTQLVHGSLTAGALKFGSFTLKSGRCDPILSSLRTAYTFLLTHSLYVSCQGLALLF
jgi:orotate phosphoribosyltransferase